jgi:hypothetical protein
MSIFCIVFFCFLISAITFAEPIVFDNGYALFDTCGNFIHAHGGGILKHAGYYYYFGENRNYNGSDTFFAVSCYRSKDLKEWEFRNNILTRDSNPDLEFAKIERPKVVYCAATDKFVMWAHKEYGSDYNQARAAVAWCDKPDGNYTYVGSFRPLGHMSRDCTLFVDDDGSGYFLSATDENSDLHLYKLTDDYLDADYRVAVIWENSWREAPCLFKRNGYYFIVSSGCTGWTPNQGKYGYATNLAGPWSSLYNLGDSTTYQSQSHYVLTLEGKEATSYLYMGDRWARAWGDYTDRSRYIWLPLEFTSDTTMEMNWYDRVLIDTETGEITGSTESVDDIWNKLDDNDASITYAGTWGTWYGNPGYMGTEHFSETIGSEATFYFNSTKARYYGFLRNDLGIADIYVDGIYQTSIDCYSGTSNYDVLLYETDTLSDGPHTLTVNVTGDSDKRSSGFEIICDAFAYYNKDFDGFISLGTIDSCRFINRHTGKVMTVSGPDKNIPDTEIQQFLYAGDNCQKWSIEQVSTDNHIITSMASGQFMDVEDDSADEGASLVQNPEDGGLAQQWLMYEPLGSGFHNILNANSGLLASIDDSSFKDGQSAVQENDYTYISQLWLLFSEPEYITNIWIEAESVTEQPDFAPFTVASGGALPEGEYIVVPDGSGDQTLPVTSGICQYDFGLDYYSLAEIYLLARAPGQYSNTYYISVDGGGYETVTLQEHPSDFLWVKWSEFALDAGPHTLNIALQEDGTGLDKILILTRRLMDYTRDGRVDLTDFAALSSYWLQDSIDYDVVPPGGDSIVDIDELAHMTNEWLN